MSTISAFCLCAICCGNDSTRTASGRAPVVGVTIAAPRRVPFGTVVEIRVPGHLPMRRRVDDRLARRFDHRWDLLMRTHKQAKEWGVKDGYVRIIK